MDSSWPRSKDDWLGRGLRALQKVEVATFVRLGHMFLVQPRESAGVGLLGRHPRSAAARGMYASLGFEEIPPYYFNPIPGAHYLKAGLA